MYAFRPVFSFRRARENVGMKTSALCRARINPFAFRRECPRSVGSVRVPLGVCVPLGTHILGDCAYIWYIFMNQIYTLHLNVVQWVEFVVGFLFCDKLVPEKNKTYIFHNEVLASCRALCMGASMST